jgi:hypothetical protein
MVDLNPRVHTTEFGVGCRNNRTSWSSHVRLVRQCDLESEMTAIVASLDVLCHSVE